MKSNHTSALPISNCNKVSASRINEAFVLNSAGHLSNLKETSINSCYLDKDEKEETLLFYEKQNNELNKQNISPKRLVQLKDYQSATDVLSTCSMNKERIIETKATLLTPISASKVCGKESHLYKQVVSRQNQKALKKAGKKMKDLSSLQHQALDFYYIDSESDISSLSPESFTDSCSVISDSSFPVSSKSVSMQIPENKQEIFSNEKLSADEQLQISKNVNNFHFISNKDKDKLQKVKEENITNRPVSSSNILQLSPSQSLPVPQIEGFYGTNLPSLAAIPSPYITVMDCHSKPQHDDLDLSDVSSQISNYSGSSMSLDQDGLLLSHNYSADDTSSADASGQKIQECEKEIRELKQSLKLAEADTAILVSSKQQLQLDNHVLREEKKMLDDQLQINMKKIVECEKNIAVLTRSKSVIQEKFAAEIQQLEKEILNLKSKTKELSDNLEATQLEKDGLKNDLSETSRTVHTFKVRYEHLQTEISDLLKQNVKLETLVEQYSDDNSGNHNYISLLREERDEYAKKLSEKEQEMMKKQMLVKQLEERFSTLYETNISLKAKNDELSRNLHGHENLVSTLQSQLTAKSEEKRTLDEAVHSLHRDLYRVESSFMKIRKEMTQKAGVAQRGASLNSQLESQNSSLQAELKQLQNDSSTQVQRIKDKNNQISQLLNQLKASLIAKNEADRKIGMLESHITVNEKSWVNAVEKERSYVRTIEEKNAALTENNKRLEETASLLSKKSVELHALQQAFSQKMSLLSEKDLQADSLRNDICRLDDDFKKTKGLLRSKETFINDLEQRIEELLHRNRKLQEQFDRHREESLQHQRSIVERDEDRSDDLQMEMLAELQASRRDLNNRVTSLQEENEEQRKRMNKEKEKWSEEISLKDEEVEQLKKQLTNLASEKIRLTDDVSQKTKEIETNQSKSEDLVAMVTRESSSLQRQLAETEAELEKSKSTSEESLKDLKTLRKQNQNLRDELMTAKEEMNFAQLKLLDEMRDKKEEPSEEEVHDLRNRLHVMKNERDKLKEAVEQQQRYLVSLQLHYQQWACKAATQLQMAQESSAVEKATINKQDASTQTSHEDKPLGSLPISFSHEIVKNCDAFTQTSHDERIVSISHLKNIDAIEESCHISDCKGNYQLNVNKRHPQSAILDDSIQQVGSDSSSFISLDSLDPVHQKPSSRNPTHSAQFKKMADVSTQTCVHHHTVAIQTSDLHHNILQTPPSGKLAALEDGKNQTEDLKDQQGNCCRDIVTQTPSHPMIDSSSQVDAVDLTNYNKSYCTTDISNNGVNSETSRTGCSNFPLTHNKSASDSSSQTDLSFFQSDNSIVKTRLPLSEYTSAFTQTDSVSKTEANQLQPKKHCDLFSSTDLSLQNSINDKDSQCNLLSSSFDRDEEVQTPVNDPVLTSFIQIDPRKVTAIKETSFITNKPATSYCLTTSSTQTTDMHINHPSKLNKHTQVLRFSKDFSTQTENAVYCVSSTDPYDVNRLSIFSDENADAHARCGQFFLESSPNRSLAEAGTQTHFQDILLDSFPDAADVADRLHQEDVSKLNAYKQTVKVLKKKLKKADQESNLHRNTIMTLQQEMDALKKAMQENETNKQKSAAKDHLFNFNSSIPTEDTTRLTEEMEHWKELFENSDLRVTTLQLELDQLKRTHRSEMEKMKRKDTGRRMIRERKLKEVNERLRALVDANERLRKAVDQLQIKLTARTQQLEVCRRDKLRYQHRARKLQADLRSLSWLPAHSPDEEAKKNAKCDDVTHTQSTSIELPSAVAEIDDILKSLRSEIMVLEQQLDQHSSAVHQSNASFKELRLNESLLMKKPSDANPGKGSGDAKDDSIDLMTVII